MLRLSLCLNVIREVGREKRKPLRKRPINGLREAVSELPSLNAMRHERSKYEFNGVMYSVLVPLTGIKRGLILWVS